jgi:hypothetical protein
MLKYALSYGGRFLLKSFKDIHRLCFFFWSDVYVNEKIIRVSIYAGGAWNFAVSFMLLNPDFV